MLLSKASRKKASEPSEPKSIQNQLFKLREGDYGETQSSQATVHPAVNL